MKRLTRVWAKTLSKGWSNLVEDLERGGGELEISKTQYEAEVGKNLAVTDGSVIFGKRSDATDSIHTDYQDGL